MYKRELFVIIFSLQAPAGLSLAGMTGPGQDQEKVMSSEKKKPGRFSYFMLIPQEPM